MKVLVRVYSWIQEVFDNSQPLHWIEKDSWHSSHQWQSMWRGILFWYSKLGFANFFCEEPDRKYFRLCGSCSLCCHDSPLSLQCKGSHKWMSGTLFTKAASGADLAHELGLLASALNFRPGPFHFLAKSPLSSAHPQQKRMVKIKMEISAHVQKNNILLY